MKVLLQTSQSDCLLACAAMIMSKYRCDVPVYKLAEKIELSIAGSNVLQLREVLGIYGFKVDGYKIPVESLQKNICPVIAYVNKKHFIVIEKIRKAYIVAIDPALGRTTYSINEFKQIYSNVIINVLPKDNIKENQIQKKKTYESFKIFVKQKKMLIIFFGLMITSLFTQGVALMYTFVYKAIERQSNYISILLVMFISLLLLIAGSLIQGGLTKSFNVFYEKIYGNQMMERMVDKNFRFFSLRNNGDLMYRINARGMIKDSVLLKFVPSIIAACTVILTFFLIFQENILLGSILTITIIAYFVAYIFLSKMAYIASNRYTQKVVDLNTTTENIIRTILTIKVLGVKTKFLQQWWEQNTDQAEKYGKIVLIQSVQTILTSINNYLMPIIISIIGILTDKSSEGIYHHVAILPLVYLVVQNTTQVSQAFSSLYMVLPNIEKIDEVMDKEFMTNGQRTCEKLEDSIYIKVKDMTFSYGIKKCLDSVNVNIEKGKKYAVIGKSGSGKSTFLKILANLLDGYNGKVIYNSKYNSQPIYMDQESSILDDTIFENVVFGQDYLPDRVEKVCRDVGLDTIVKEQINGWNTKISKGKNLSRGQEQRICLARCLIRDANIYLLDEATSNIDSADEDKIIENILGKSGLLGEKTVFISTHKLNMIHYVDEVLFVNDKKIFLGKHEDLLKLHIEYANLFK